MSAKPSNVYAWNTGGANNTEPSAGKKVLGWIRGEKPASSYFNWLLGGISLWVKYLSDGAFTGDHSITGNFTLTGAEYHSARELPVPAAAFQVVAVAASFATGSIPDTDGVQWAFGSAAAGTIVAPINLPVGKRIKTITWNFSKASQAAALTMKLYKANAAGATALSTTADVSNGAGYIAVTTAAINYAIESGYQVYLQVTAGHASHIFGWANIAYDAVP